jgi:hypothetical protein
MPIFLPSSAGVISIPEKTKHHPKHAPLFWRGKGSWMNPAAREEKCPLKQGHVFALKRVRP